jgi:hypothetical protein
VELSVVLESIQGYWVPGEDSISPGQGQSEDPIWLAARGQAGLIRMLIKQKTQLSMPKASLRGNSFCFNAVPMF